MKARIYGIFSSKLENIAITLYYYFPIDQKEGAISEGFNYIATVNTQSEAKKYIKTLEA